MIPKQYNILDRELFFLHEGELLSCECQLSVNTSKKLDVFEIIGEIVTETEDVREVKTKIVETAFYEKFGAEIEEVRSEVLVNVL